MTASNWTPAYGWGVYGTYSVQSGQTIRMGLTWAGDPGPVFLTVSAGIIPSTLVREHPTRDLGARAGYAYITTEWITVTATSTYSWVEGIGVSYLGTYQAQDNRIIEEHHDVVRPPRYHVVAVEGRAVAWVRAEPSAPGHPMPAIAPAHSQHTLHLDIEIDDDGADADRIAALLSSAVAQA